VECAQNQCGPHPTVITTKITELQYLVGSVLKIYGSKATRFLSLVLWSRHHSYLLTEKLTHKEPGVPNRMPEKKRQDLSQVDLLLRVHYSYQIREWDICDRNPIFLIWEMVNWTGCLLEGNCRSFIHSKRHDGFVGIKTHWANRHWRKYTLSHNSKTLFSNAVFTYVFMYARIHSCIGVTEFLNSGPHAC
jgi:hypothetical protein